MCIQSKMTYEWDPDKAASNLRKHGVRFADASLSLADPFGQSMPDPDSLDEARFVFLGADPSGRVLVTVYTNRGRSTRIISSRKASRIERQTYEAGL